MLSQLKHLSVQTDGRYATEDELQFLDTYIQSFNLRVQTYQKLRMAETEIVKEVLLRLKATNPGLLSNGNEDITNKWKRDTIRVLRYSAAAMLVNDPKTLEERFLSWFQTIMRAFSAQQSCNATYEVMQQVVKQQLTPIQAGLFCPILELNRRYLGIAN